ncbi:MAG: hypothetical protein GAK35_03998 [Herbaspirillum frisingense]|uniref:GNAT family N-acetyltransferase n=1 Tax=Herbaspirillum frisingense TaxID=92645 RepID=A0A7V8JSP3_9BURK|nr:MAG: hypothetical protein GAK35_03998 [Herbaspirillum frisingense]
MTTAYGIPCGWKIEGPRLQPQNEVHVYAYLDGQMIGMLDCELRDSGGVQLRMAYVSPPWRGSAVLRDMLAALKGRYRRIAVLRSRRR